MPYIYKITNLINEKKYIGKTLISLDFRWKQHEKEALRERSKNRPLYRAIRKYGIENFKIELLEECTSKDLSQRECYWIDYYQTFSKGYNATLGGDGKILIDYDLVVSTYQNVKTLSETAKILNIDAGHTSSILKAMGVEVLSSQEIAKKRGKKVNMIDQKGEILMTFDSQGEAARYIKEALNLTSQEAGIASHISHVTSGKRKTAYGYRWSAV